jgi:hypothetical protein
LYPVASIAILLTGVVYWALRYKIFLAAGDRLLGPNRKSSPEGTTLIHYERLPSSAEE